MTVPGSFDSLVAKIIVTGADRTQALARSRRALRELVVEGMPTVLPFHRAVLDDPAFVAADGNWVHTRWIETEFRRRDRPYAGPVEAARSRSKVEGRGRGQRQAAGGGGAGRPRRGAAPPRRAGRPSPYAGAAPAPERPRARRATR